MISHMKPTNNYKKPYNKENYIHQIQLAHISLLPWMRDSFCNEREMTQHCKDIYEKTIII